MKKELTVIQGGEIEPPETPKELTAYLQHFDRLFDDWLTYYKGYPGMQDLQDKLRKKFKAHQQAVLKTFSLGRLIELADEEFENEFLKELKAYYEPGRGFILGGITWGEADFMPLVSNAISSLDKWPSISMIGAQTVIFNYVNKQYAKMQVEARNFLAAVDKPKGRAAVKQLVGYLKDVPDNEVNPADVAAIESMLWQVKRKAFGHYRNDWPLMNIFTGGQGYAKTGTLNYLFKPIGACVGGNKRLKDFNNPFNSIDFSRYLVLPFNDIANNERFDVQMLKSLVTDEDYQYREPHSKKSYKLYNTATLYATSNEPVAQTIPDDTGARRWWEIESPNRQATEADIARMKAIPFADCWLAVDGEDSENPRKPFLESMGKIQYVELRYIPVLEDAISALFDVGPGASPVPDFDAICEIVYEWFKPQEVKPPVKRKILQYLRKLGCMANHDMTRPKLQNICFRKPT